MRVMMTTWEYPPEKVGGIASHVYDLSKAMVRMGHDVHILTHANEDKEEYDAGITIHRYKTAENATDMTTWSVAVAHKLEKEAIKLHKQHKFDVVHAHDWMMVPSGVAIKKLLNIPMVFTLHSTEYGRSGGIHDAYTKMINDLEWYGTYEAQQVITVGKDFCKEVKGLFNVPDTKLHYIPNGVDIKKFDVPVKTPRNDFVADWESMVFFCGRMTHVKGVHNLIDAIPSIIREHPDTKFVLAGKGPDFPNYQARVKSLGIAEKVYFPGFVDDNTLIDLYRMADLTVAPSLYEPFGIVALESAAAKRPTIGSYVGGLKDTIINEFTGLHSWAGNPQSISDQVNRALCDNNWRKWMGKNGRKYVEDNFRWNKIAVWTTGVYGKSIGIW